MSADVDTQRTHHEMQGPAGSYAQQDKTESRARDPKTNTHQKVTKTTTQYRTPDVQQLIPNVNKQQLSVILPVVLAVALALLLLSYRGSLSWHKEQPKTWKDHVSEGVMNVKEGLQDGLKGYYETAKDYVSEASLKGQEKAAETLEYTEDYIKNAAGTGYDRLQNAAAGAHEKARSAAGMAHEKAKMHVGKASDYAHGKAQEASAKASDAYHNAQAKANEAYDTATNPNILHRASEYIHDKADALLNRGKTASAGATEEILHRKNIAQENARHMAAEAELKAKENVDSLKETAHDIKRNVKSKVGL